MMCFLANKIHSIQYGNSISVGWTTISHPNRDLRRESSWVLCSIPVSDHLHCDDGGGGNDGGVSDEVN